MTSAPPCLYLTTGEPAGVGPELCLRAAEREWPCALVAGGDPDMLRARAQRAGLDIRVREFEFDAAPPPRHRSGELLVDPIALHAPSDCGVLTIENAEYVLATLSRAAHLAMTGTARAIVTAPVHKGVINDAGQPFSGHTEFFAEATGGGMPVMLLAAGALRVALVTTHLPLSAVSAAITPNRLRQVIEVLHGDLVSRFHLPSPRIAVCGLNPHAGEGGHLGREEIDVIEPVLATLRDSGMDLVGPLPADTAFARTGGSTSGEYDAFLAMYHDQGLPVLKYAGFGHAVNITLGLPIIRTSVDHGTALDIAGSGRADPGSLLAAIETALQMAGPAAPTT